MRKRIWFSAIGLLTVAIVLAGLLGVIDTLAGTPPLAVSQQTGPDGSPAGPGLDNAAPNNLDKNTPGNQGKDAGNKSGGLSNNPAQAALSNPDIGLAPDISPQGGLPPHTPLFEVSGAAATSLLRSTSTLNYDGKLWHFPANSVLQDYTGGKITPNVMGFSKKITDNITVNALQDFGKGLTELPTSLYPVSVDTPVPLSYLPDEQLFLANQGLPQSYSFETVKYVFDKSKLEKAQIAQDSKYLQLPSEVTDRTRQLAQEITAGIESPYQKAQALEDYLKKNYSYDTQFKPAPTGQEPNDWFLFQEKKGVCSNFNSAFVTLARSAGLPSRLVGGYAITPELNAQTVYADQSHAWSEVEFKDLGWQTFDATGSTPGQTNAGGAPPTPTSTVNNPKAASTATEITSVSNTVKKGSSFSVKGKVTSAGTIVEGMLVELFINPKKSQQGGILVGKGTVAGGAFDIEANIPNAENVGNYQLLAHAITNIRFQESWSDPRIKVTAETLISLEMPVRIRFKDTLQVKGALNEKTENPVGGQQIEIDVNKAPVAHVITDQKGIFNWVQIFNAPGRYNVDTIFASTEFYEGARQQATLDVLLPAAITLQAPDKATEQTDVTLSGTLQEELTGKPIPGQKINILVNNQPLKKEVSTDSKGAFTFQNSFDKAGIYQIEVVSDYTAKYWESRISSAIEILPLNRQFPWLYLILTIFILAVGVGIYFLYTRNNQGYPAVNGSPAALVEPPALPIIPEDYSHKAVLKIYFPGIAPPFPDVWGINEELEINFKLLDPSGRIISGGKLNIRVKDRQTALTTGDDGTAGLLLTFSEKATYTIEAVYDGTGEIKGVKAERTIKIVDYREEIVYLYKSLKDWFYDRGLPFPLEATPREIQEIVTASKLGIPSEVLAKLVEYFEEADYSLHPVNRENYLRMYLVQREVREHGQ
jgi:transglutaminase-like putative cysteine protease